jgi:Leucine-rich repeat (LRR) protein
MTIKELHQDLIEAYSVSNLNTISLTPINLLKNLEYVELSGNKINIEQINKLTGIGVTVDFE